MSTGRPTAPRWQALSGPLSLCRSGPGGDDRTKRGNGSVGTGVERASQNDVMELVCDVPGTSTLATASCLATFRRHTTLPPTTADPRRIHGGSSPVIHGPALRGVGCVPRESGPVSRYRIRRLAGPARLEVGRGCPPEVGRCLGGCNGPPGRRTGGRRAPRPGQLRRTGWSIRAVPARPRSCRWDR